MAMRPVVGAPIARKKRVEDLVLWENEQRYTRCGITLAAGTYLIGDVIVNATISPTDGGAQPVTSDVLCLENVIVPAGQSWEVAALVRGPALVNLDEVTRVGAETDAALRTRLADLTVQLVRFVREPVKQSTPDLGG